MRMRPLTWAGEGRAYGHGAARGAGGTGAGDRCVSRWHEAAVLRGGIDAPLPVLSEQPPQLAAVGLGVISTVYSYAQIAALEAVPATGIESNSRSTRA
jgi:hypothetical protein